MIKQAEKNYEPKVLEGKIQEFWNKTKAYKKTKDRRSSGEDFYFIDGPPYTTGSIHPGTAWNKTVKDCVLRFLRMKGLNVWDKAGFDMHGLPIEVQVEKTLGINNKKDIEELGIEKFISTCKDFAIGYQQKMTAQFKALGIWLDWENPYTTITNSYMQSAWWTIKVAYEKDQLILSKRVLQWCPRCETALAESEIEYWDETDPSIFVKFMVKGRRDEYILAWTTTPWTIPANMAIAVHPNFTYARVRVLKDGKREVVIMLEEKIEEIAQQTGIEKYEILETMLGERLTGLEYFHPLMAMVPFQKSVKGDWVHKVVISETVTNENTGCVHIAPGHGPEDFEIGRQFSLPSFCPVDERGVLNDEAGFYKGLFVKDSNTKINEDLQKMRALHHHDRITHRYGHCWRCKTSIIYRVTEQWFLKVSELRDVMLDEVHRVQWTPEWAGSARQYDWVANAKDWCISRQRYWGIPIPIWRCKCGEMKVVGSMDELRQGEEFDADMDLHRPHIDKVTFKCPKCSEKMERIQDVLDVWFDSAVCSWAQLNYPTEMAEFKRWWPCKWITEACDQTRGWFYSQLGAGVLAFGQCPYDSVLMHGWMNDSKGQPMSKSAGNFVDIEDLLEEHGADALRFYFLKINAPWEDINFVMDEVRNAKRSLNILWNVYVFASMYMAIDKFDPKRISPEALIRALKPEDRWLISRLEKLKLVVDEEIRSYNLHRAARELEGFILEDLSRWYIKLVRKRMWSEVDEEDKMAAYKVLHESLITLAKLMTPMTPHISEAIYQTLDGELLTVQMCDWPSGDESLINERLETEMVMVREIVESASKARQAEGIKLRWPVKEVVIKCNDDETAEGLEYLRDILVDKLNTKKLDILRPDQEWEGLTIEIKPRSDVIGKVYRQWASRIAVILENRPPEVIKGEIEKGEYKLGIDGQMIRILPTMVNFIKKEPENFISIEGVFGSMYIDTESSPELMAEGFAREVVRRVQEMRKEVDMDVEDYLKTQIKARGEVLDMLKKWREFIAFETRSRSLDFNEEEINEEYMVEWQIEKETIGIGITPLYIKEAIESYTKIPGMTPKKAIALYDADYKTLHQLDKATKTDLLKVRGIGEADARHIREFFEKPEDQRFKKVNHCPFCGVELPPRATKCPRCDELVREDIKICKNCGREVPMKTEHCYYCGAHPDKEKAVAPKVAPEKAVVAEAAAGTEEELETPAEAKPAQEAKVRELPDLFDSSIYLLKESKAENSYKLFIRYIKEGKKGFCATRVYPGKIKSHYKLEKVPIIWLSNVAKDESIRPKDLEKLSYSIERHISEGNAIVLLEGLEYLITNNNFITVLRLIQALRDQVAMHSAILVMPINPVAIDPHQMNLLEKEVDSTLDFT